jgi:hypothetical protein
MKAAFGANFPRLGRNLTIGQINVVNSAFVGDLYRL